MQRIEIIRSKRKSISIEIKPDERIIVRAPMFASDGEIRRFVEKHDSWIEKHLEIIRRKREELRNLPAITAEELRLLAEKAKEYIPRRVEYYAKKIGVTYGRITIRNQKTRWGSCSAKGNLNFNCLLMLAPPEVIDSVVVHELCHRKQMNHSERFYDEVLRIYPEYRKWNDWLKKNGASLIAGIKKE